MNKKRYISFGMLLLLCLLGGLVMAGCFGKKEDQYKGIEYVIGISQANMRDPWRLQLMNELKEEAGKHANIRLITTDATSDAAKQTKDVEKMLDFGIDLLIISPCDVEEMTPAISKVYQEIPVIVMDKAVEGFDYTLFIGPDNQLIGRQAGEAVTALLEKEPGNVLELGGSRYSQASLDKSAGFRDIFERNRENGMKTIRVESELKDDAEDMVYALGSRLLEYDVIFAHNDYMALGAYHAMKKLGVQRKIVGIDGFNGEKDGINLVKQGIIDETIACSTGGKEAIQYALDILKEVSGVPKQVILRSHTITKDNVDAYVEKQNSKERNYTGIIDVGYSQVGTESAWRLANTRSIKEAAKDAGINLIFEDGSQSQEKQIEALRKFIKMKVDVIVLSPVVDNGWDEVLEEAGKAGIPVLLSDRKINIENDGAYTTYIGADFMEEGRRAMRWIRSSVHKEEGSVRIFEIQGTAFSSPTVERKEGFEEILKETPKYNISYSENGDFTFAGGEKVIEEYLLTHEWDMDVIYAHNDDMALGAITALKNHGIQPGVDVKIVSVDGTKKAFEAMIDGDLNCVVECNPLLGPQLMKVVKDLMNQKDLPLRIITEEKIYTQEQAKELIRTREY